MLIYPSYIFEKGLTNALAPDIANAVIISFPNPLAPLFHPIKLAFFFFPPLSYQSCNVNILKAANYPVTRIPLADIV